MTHLRSESWTGDVQRPLPNSHTCSRWRHISLGSIKILPSRGSALLMPFNAFLLPKLSKDVRTPHPASMAEWCQETHPCTSTSSCSPLSTSMTGFFLSIKSLKELIHQVNFNDSQQRCYADEHDSGFSSGSVLVPDYSHQIAQKVKTWLDGEYVHPVLSLGDLHRVMVGVVGVTGRGSDRMPAFDF